MNTATLPISLACTEELSYELNSKIRGIRSLLNERLFRENWLDRAEPHADYTAAERDRLRAMVIPFEDECRENFIRIPNAEIASQYRYLLRQQFAFIASAPRQLEDCRLIFWQHFEEQGPNTRGEEWQEQNKNSYYGELIEWPYFLNDELVYKIQEILDEYDTYFSGPNAAKTPAHKELTQATTLPIIEQRNAACEPLTRLTWSCKPAVAGYIISELIRAGYVSPPITNGELSLNKLARICEQLFDFAEYNPGLSSWRNVIDPERNSLPDIKRTWLNLPDADQL